MTIPDVLALIRAGLERTATEERRRGLIQYFKQPVNPYGARAAAVRKAEQGAARIVRQWPAAAVNRLCAELMKSGRLEEGMVVT